MPAVGSKSVWSRQKGSVLRSDLVVVLGLYLSLCMQLPPGVYGHGYLTDPPSRSSEWRLGFKNPINYNDNGLSCGGFTRQWLQNGGRCGVCGDPWDVAPPRPNEVGGMYANGIIVRQYSVGQVVEMNVTITAQHGGWFEFRLCPDAESVDAPTTQECLEANLLEVKDGSSRTRYQLPLNAAKGSFKVKVKLPEGLVCSHCVLHWKWHVGNSWGVGSDGVGCLGCGPQEEFINCADISIASNSSVERTASPSPTSLSSIRSTVPSRIPSSSVSTNSSFERTTSPSPKPTTSTSLIKSMVSSSTPRSSSSSNSSGERTTSPSPMSTSFPPIRSMVSSRRPSSSVSKNSSGERTASPWPNFTTSTSPISSTVPSRRNIGLPSSSTTLSRITSASSSTTSKTTRVSSRTSSKSPITLQRLSTVTRLLSTSTSRPASSCRAIGLFEGDTAMDGWCILNCALNFCPGTHCKCDEGDSEIDFTGCTSLGIWKSDTMDKWCVSNCAAGFCPPDYCQC